MFRHQICVECLAADVDCEEMHTKHACDNVGLYNQMLTDDVKAQRSQRPIMVVVRHQDLPVGSLVVRKESLRRCNSRGNVMIRRVVFAQTQAGCAALLPFQFALVASLIVSLMTARTAAYAPSSTELWLLVSQRSSWLRWLARKLILSAWRSCSTGILSDSSWSSNYPGRQIECRQHMAALFVADTEHDTWKQHRVYVGDAGHRSF